MYCGVVGSIGPGLNNKYFSILVRTFDNAPVFVTSLFVVHTNKQGIFLHRTIVFATPRSARVRNSHRRGFVLILWIVLVHLLGALSDFSLVSTPVFAPRHNATRRLRSFTLVFVLYSPTTSQHFSNYILL